jgi:hypothetical protein
MAMLTLTLKYAINPYTINPFQQLIPLSKDYKIDCFIVAHNAPCELSIDNVY